MTPPWSRVHRLRRRAASLRIDAILNEPWARDPGQSLLSRSLVWDLVNEDRAEADRLAAEAAAIEGTWRGWLDRKSTRLNSSHT